MYWESQTLEERIIESDNDTMFTRCVLVILVYDNWQETLSYQLNRTVKGSALELTQRTITSIESGHVAKRK